MGTYDSRGGSPAHNPLFDGGPDPSPLQEAVWALLEDAGAPNALCEQIDGLIGAWEREAQQAADEETTYRLWNAADG
jgi:hypothetical protein